MATLGSIGLPGARGSRAARSGIPPFGVAPRNQPRAQCTSSLPASLSILAAGVKAEWHSAQAPALTPSAPQDSVQQDRQGVLS